MTLEEVAIWLRLAAEADLERLELDTATARLRLVRRPTAPVPEPATAPPVPAAEPKVVRTPTFGTLLDAHPLASAVEDDGTDILGYLAAGPCLRVLRAAEPGAWRPAVPIGSLLGYGAVAFERVETGQASTGTV